MDICEESYSSVFPSLSFPKRGCHLPKIKKVNIELPFNGWVGIFLCLVLLPSDCHQHPSQIIVHSIQFNGCPIQVQSDWSIHIGEKYGKLESHHLGLFHFPKFYHHSNPPCSPIDAERFYQLEIEIDTGNLEVEKIGFCLEKCIL